MLHADPSNQLKGSEKSLFQYYFEDIFLTYSACSFPAFPWSDKRLESVYSPAVEH